MDYIPWIRAAELNSTGTASNLVDWKHGRALELLSQGEKWLYLILRWNDRVVDIREQFPLDIDETNAIADELGVKRADRGKTHMTTDLLVTLDDGSLRAYSVKANAAALTDRCCELLAVEKTYWQRHKVPWRNVLKTELNRVYARNIESVVQYYKVDDSGHPINRLKHLIATKQICVDMKSAPLDYRALVKEYLDD